MYILPFPFKALANEDRLLRTYCCSWCCLGAQTRGTQNECCVSMLRKLGKICCGHKYFWTKSETFFVFRTKFVSATNVARAGKRGNICGGNNVSATMCPRLQGSLRVSSSADQEARGLWVRDCDQFLDQSCKFIAHDEGLTLETSAF